MDTQRLLEEFPAYLEANRLARPQHIPHLRRWAERYLGAPGDDAAAGATRRGATALVAMVLPGRGNRPGQAVGPGLLIR